MDAQIITRLCLLVVVLTLAYVFQSSIMKSPSPFKLHIDFYKPSSNRTVSNGGIDDITVCTTPSKTLNDKVMVAIGCAVTTRDMSQSELDNIGQSMAFFTTLLPSVCQTISKHYIYKFYLAYDQHDALFSREKSRELFQEIFNNMTEKSCPKGVNIGLNFVHCNHTGNPAWAQNDAMMQAYMDNSTYFFRVNDDSSIVTPGWTEKFILVLQSYDPPNVGVVGPTNSGDNLRILTHDFVHRTHIDLFGYYYPRIFKNWYADGWITHVYEPNRSTKVKEIKVDHTRERGTRYNKTKQPEDFVWDRIEKDKSKLKR